MTNASLLLIFAGMTCASVVTLTVALLVTARDLRATLQRLQGILPACDQTVHEARHTLAEARQLLTRTNNTTRHVESVVHQACTVASDALAQVGAWKDRAQQAWGGRLGNGARSRPRRKHEE